jgi:hypothetical protein
MQEDPTSERAMDINRGLYEEYVFKTDGLEV